MTTQQLFCDFAVLKNAFDDDESAWDLSTCRSRFSEEQHDQKEEETDQ